MRRAFRNILSRSVKMLPIVAVLVVLGATSAHAATCFAEPVTAKPYASAGPNQFTFQFPMSPALSAQHHWLLVDDYPDVSPDGLIRTGYINISGGGPKSELFWVSPTYNAVNGGQQYNSCTIEAQMLVNGSTTTPVNLVFKQNGITSDGPTITVDENDYLKEYEREMPVNPITNQPWTSDEIFSQSLIVGIKNDTSVTGWGVGFADIILYCK